MNSKVVLDINSIVSRKDGLDTTDLDRDKVMMDIDKGKYYVLNEVASEIWDIVVQPSSVRNIVDILMSKYIIDEKSCLENTMEFLIKLKNEELICIS